jgi:hypothetical protein
MKQRKQPKAEPMVIVVAFMRQGKPPKWQAVSEPITRASAVLVVRDQWQLGNPARITPAPAASAA